MTFEQKQCQAGCIRFEGGEVKHHKDCDFYPESQSKMYDDAMVLIEKLRKTAKEGYVVGYDAAMVKYKICENDRSVRSENDWEAFINTIK